MIIIEIDNINSKFEVYVKKISPEDLLAFLLLYIV